MWILMEDEPSWMVILSPFIVPSVPVLKKLDVQEIPTCLILVLCWNQYPVAVISATEK